MKNSPKENRSKKSFRKTPSFYGFSIGITTAIVAVFLLLIPSNDQYHAPGPFNVGHEKLKCASCHKQSEGTTRQQLQAKIRYFLKLRKSNIEFGMKSVENDVCLECHARPNERHPAYRFNEPRFAKQFKEFGPHRCASCHQEHQGVRIALDSTSFCKACHRDTRLENDPLTVTHSQLVAKNNWASCMGCHDYHGNHEMKTNLLARNIINTGKIKKYFEGRLKSPYSEKKKYSAQRGFEND
jgi:hypothetical protein